MPTASSSARLTSKQPPQHKVRPAHPPSLVSSTTGRVRPGTATGPAAAAPPIQPKHRPAASQAAAPSHRQQACRLFAAQHHAVQKPSSGSSSQAARAKTTKSTAPAQNLARIAADQRAKLREMGQALRSQTGAPTFATDSRLGARRPPITPIPAPELTKGPTLKAFPPSSVGAKGRKLGAEPNPLSRSCDLTRRLPAVRRVLGSPAASRVLTHRNSFTSPIASECPSSKLELSSWRGRGLVERGLERRASILDSPSPDSHKDGPATPSSSEAGTSPDLLMPTEAKRTDDSSICVQSENHHVPPRQIEHTPWRPAWKHRLSGCDASHPASSIRRYTPPFQTPATRNAGVLLRRKMMSRHMLGSPDSSTILSRPPKAPRRIIGGRGAMIIGILGDNPNLIELACEFDDDPSSMVVVPAGMQGAFPRSPGEESLPSIQRSALSVAAKCSSVGAVAKLINLGADPTQVDSEGRHLIHILFLPSPDNVTAEAEVSISAEMLPRHAHLYDTVSRRLTPPPTPPSALMAGTRRGSLVTPRIADTTRSRENDMVKRGKCVSILPRGAAGDSLSEVINILSRNGLDITKVDAHGHSAVEYARKWFVQAGSEIADTELDFASRLAACCIRAAALTVLTIEDHVRLSAFAPSTTKFVVQTLKKPVFNSGYFVEVARGKTTSLAPTNWRKSPCRWSQSRFRVRSRRPSVGEHAASTSLNEISELIQPQRNHPGFLKVYEFLGASFSPDNSNGIVR